MRADVVTDQLNREEFARIQAKLGVRIKQELEIPAPEPTPPRPAGVPKPLDAGHPPTNGAPKPSAPENPETR